MKPLFAVLFACFGASVLADAPGPGDWRQANERVGGWGLEGLRARDT